MTASPRTVDEVRSVAELASVRHRGPMLARNFWRHVRVIDTVANANSFRPLAGRNVPVVVVGAGPSLDRNVHVLREYQNRVCILAVNTAARALVKAGVTPHAVVAIETVDVADHCPEGIPILTSPTAHPAIWNRAKWWTVEGSSCNVRLCRFWGVRPGQLGVAAATTALAQGIEWGANAVILMGADLAAEPGHLYATGSAWEDVTTELANFGEEGGDQPVRVAFNNPRRREEIFEREGVPAPSRMRSHPIPVEGWNGGLVTTVGEFLTQIDWLQRKAARCPVPIVNATEGGARLANTIKLSAEEALALYAPEKFEGIEDHARCVGEDEKDTAIEDVRQQCADAMQWTRRYLRGQVLPVPVIPTIPAVYEIAFPGLLGVTDRINDLVEQRHKLPDAAKLSAFYYTLFGAAAQLLRQLNGESWDIPHATLREATNDEAPRQHHHPPDAA